MQEFDVVYRDESASEQSHLNVDLLAVQVVKNAQTNQLFLQMKYRLKPGSQSHPLVMEAAIYSDSGNMRIVEIDPVSVDKANDGTYFSSLRLGPRGEYGEISHIAYWQKEMDPPAPETKPEKDKEGKKGPKPKKRLIAICSTVAAAVVIAALCLVFVVPSLLNPTKDLICGDISVTVPEDTIIIAQTGSSDISASYEGVLIQLSKVSGKAPDSDFLQSAVKRAFSSFKLDNKEVFHVSGESCDSLKWEFNTTSGTSKQTGYIVTLSTDKDTYLVMTYVLTGSGSVDSDFVDEKVNQANRIVNSVRIIKK